MARVGVGGGGGAASVCILPVFWDVQAASLIAPPKKCRFSFLEMGFFFGGGATH